MRRAQNPDAVFQSIRTTAEITGLSQKSIREGCREGSVPHIRVGSDYRVHLPNFLRMLSELSEGGSARWHG